MPEYYHFKSASWGFLQYSIWSRALNLNMHIRFIIIKQSFLI